jgi:putative phosphoesterase
MKECVHQENAIQQHHQMRITAKRLRYTMEIFSPLYEDNLKEFISLLKQIQDYLGEMHDCDVWIQYIPQFIEKIQNEQDNSLDIGILEAGLNEFLRYIQNRRHLLYKDFISLWDKNQKQEIFDKLLEKIHIITLQIPDAQKKIAIIADEHGNIHALNAVMDDAKKHEAILFLHAGDFVGYGAYPSDVIRQLKSEIVLNIIGNYDQNALRTKSKGKGKRKNNDPKTISLNFTRKHLSKKDIMFLRSLPQELQIQIGSCRILLAHGSPESPEEHLKPTTSDNRLRTLAHRISADIVIIGHSHQPFVKTVDNVTFINPGSVGRPDDANPQASYALMTLNPFSVELLRVPYDVNAAVQALRKYRLPELFAQMLLHGISLEAIEDLDKKRGVLSVKNNKMRLKQVQQLAEKFSDDLTHPIQVRRLALILFDELKELFSFDENDKLLLECAALLHDIGWSQGWKGHHKTSLRLILNDTKIPFTIQERYIIGSIARYHRKTVPQQKHYHFSALKLDDQRRARILSAIMKIADGLDASHHSIVKNINIKINTSTITMQCIVTGPFDLEQRAVDKKKTLFEQISKRRLIIQWQKN